MSCNFNRLMKLAAGKQKTCKHENGMTPLLFPDDKMLPIHAIPLVCNDCGETLVVID